jgi:hypothetical protein
MDTYYIASNSATFNDVTNVRLNHTTDSSIIAALSVSGTRANLIREKIVGQYIWSNYIFESGDVGWIRNDVHNKVRICGANIDVPYISQEDRDSDEHVNDCGVACALMLARRLNDQTLTVEAMAKLLNMGRYTLTSFQHIYDTLNRYRVSFAFKRPFNITHAFQSLNLGKPIISLINYGAIFPTKPIPHFIVIRGYDEQYMYINDPLNFNNKKIPYDIYSRAIGTTNENGNLPLQSIYEK